METKTNPTKRVLNVDQFCERYGVGRTTAYLLLRKHELGSVSVGARRLIPVESAEAWLATLVAKHSGHKAA